MNYFGILKLILREINRWTASLLAELFYCLLRVEIKATPSNIVTILLTTVTGKKVISGKRGTASHLFPLVGTKVFQSN